MSPKVRRIVEMKLGMGGESPMTTREAARRLDVTVQRISMAERHALKYVRHREPVSDELTAAVVRAAKTLAEYR